MSSPTLWLIAALLLAGLEMLTGTFYLLAIAIALASAALAAWLGWTFTVQAVIAAVVSIVGVGLLKRWHRQEVSLPSDVSSDIGQHVIIMEWQGERRARVRYRGTLWDAELAADASSGLEDYIIVDMHGSTLILIHSLPRHS